ncbi:MAG: hypothetical protein JXQ27_16985 [Acidobacteria bacterium]|nr:hypothetical protein [Acidobacteriota bacterium]
MSEPTPRAAAVHYLGQVLRQEEPPELLGQTPEFAGLSPADRQLAFQLVWGTLRELRLIDAVLDRFCRRPLRHLNILVQNVLRTSAYQLLMLDRVPDYAVVNEAVTLIKRSYFRKQSGFVNAVLRRVARIQDVQAYLALDLATADGLATAYSHPTFLVQRWLERESPGAVRSWLARSNHPPNHHLVLNPQRMGFDEFLSRCSDTGLKIVTVHAGLATVEVSGSFTWIQPLIEDGACFVQDLWSHLLVRLIPPGRYDRILDCCAAPGGKSFSLALRFPDASIMAADVNHGRLLAMQRRAAPLELAGGLQLVAANGLHPPWRREQFDLVLLDAPCSGTGTLQRNPDLRWKIDLPKILRLSHLQSDLLQSAAALVRPGGMLVYATCSAEPEENEAVVRSFLRRTPGSFVAEAPVEFRPGVITSEGYYRTFPAMDSGDGFFGAFLRRIQG